MGMALQHLVVEKFISRRCRKLVNSEWLLKGRERKRAARWLPRAGRLRASNTSEGGRGRLRCGGVVMLWRFEEGKLHAT